MQALILAGGRGERMRPLTDRIPKVMLPIQGKPFLTYLIEYLKDQGVKDIILAVCWKKEKIKNYFKDGKDFGVKTKYCEEKKPLGTGGAIRNAKDLIKGKNIIILNGDSFVKINLKEMLRYHKKMNLPITIAVLEMKNPERFGRVIINKNNIVIGFKEKGKVRGKAFINAGVYIFKKEVVEEIPKNKRVSLEKEIFPKFLGRISAFRIKNYFIDIGIKKDYQKFKKEFKKIWKK
jgi:mannose-1-phosphate guanylyltransferase